VTGTFAAIDMGSHSTNLLIASAQGRELHRVVTVTGMTREGGEARLAAQLDLYARLLDEHGVDPSHRRVVATAAARALDADARTRLFDLVEQRVAVRPELLTGEHEGRLAFRGAVAALPPEATTPGAAWLVIDIGGASTEVMLGREEPDHVISLDVGAVTLTEGELHSDPPRPEELSNAVGRVADELADAVRAWPVDITQATLVGVAGTIVTAAAVEIGLRAFDAAALHGFTLTRPAAEDVFRTLATEALADRVHNPGLPADRAEVIVGGLCILVAAMRTLRAPHLVVSVHNLLDGVVAEMVAASTSGR
jgi:exopolyphosphatase / guanosine-5'-triphosphate,3'-diphosphate pyrophosphatase